MHLPANIKTLPLFFLLLLSTGKVAFAQQKDFKQFHTGLLAYEDNGMDGVKIERTEKTQVETDVTGEKIHLRIKWTSDSTYVLRWDKKSDIKNQLPSKEIHVTIIAVDGKRYQYRTKIKGLPPLEGWIRKID